MSEISYVLDLCDSERLANALPAMIKQADYHNTEWIERLFNSIKLAIGIDTNPMSSCNFVKITIYARGFTAVYRRV